MEDQDPLTLETMSDGDVLPPSAPFTRGCKARSSLPVGRSNGQSRERQLGVLYLQYGEETKQIRMPTDISTQDALRALFVTAFPHQLTMKMLQSPNMAIYIKDTGRNVYYDLEDIRNITPHSCLKAYHKDPAHVFNRHVRPASTEGRISKEVLYSSHSPVHTLSSSNRSTLHSLQGSMSPPMVRSMPSSPSRMAYGGGGARGGSKAVDPSSATLPRDCLSAAGRTSTLCTSSSAILERRDVKPDEDIGSSKSMALVVRGEGGPLYPDSYCSSLQEGRGSRLSTSSSQCSAPPSLTADMVDSGVLGIPGGLQQYRASVKPLMGYGESMEPQTRSLHRQKSRKYGDSQPPVGTKTPPPSPHRVSEVRMSDGQIIGGLGLVSSERMSPIRRSLRRDSNGAPVEVINRSRGSGSSSSTSSVFVDSPPERLFQGYVTSTGDQSERMKAMEEQIASLAGLVHHALSMGSDVAGFKEAISESAGCKPFNRLGMSSEPQNPDTLTDNFSTAPLALQAPHSDSELQHRLVSAKRNVYELRLQLSQLRRLQLSNQESVNSMLRMAGQELVVLMCERLTQSEEAAYRRRAKMEEERIHYLATEERILTQLSELEDYVDRLQRSSTPSSSHLSVSLRDVEDGAVSLRSVGEALAILKGEFPELQGKMRSVLRLEVEAVRFLKEEPLKMDSMLKRVKVLTETLSSLRRCVSESTPTVKSAQVEPIKVLETDQQSPQSSPKPQPRSSVRPPLPTLPFSESEADVSLAGSASPIMAQRMNSTAASAGQPSHHHSSPPTTCHGRNSPTVAKVSPHSRDGSPALQRKAGLQDLDGLDKPAATIEQEGYRDQITTAERQTPERSLSVKTSNVNLSSSILANQPASSDSRKNQSSNTSTDTSTVRASSVDPISDVSDHTESGPHSASGQTCPTEPKQDTPLSLTFPASVEQEDMSTKLSDEVDSTQLKPPDTAPASQPPAATVQPPPSAASSAPPPPAPSSSSSSTERCGRPQMEKPRRSSVDKEMKQSPDRAGKSPPPPPPRRFHAVSSGVTTGRSGDVVLTIRKKPVGAQDDDDKEKEPIVPQPKPPRQPPEVKPKPQMCAPAPLPGSSSTTTAPAYREDKEEEEEEDNTFMNELQVFQKCRGVETGMLEFSASEVQSRKGNLQVTTELSNKNHTKQNLKVETRTSSNSQAAIQMPSELSCDQKSAPQLKINGCAPKVKNAAGLEEHSKNEKSEASLFKKKKVEDPVPSFDCAPAEKVEVPTLQTQNKVEAGEVITVPSSQKETDLAVNNNQINKDTATQIISPTAERKVKFTTVVNLQKDNFQGTDTSPKNTTAEKKSKMTVVLTLQKENTTKDCLLEPPTLSPQSVSLDTDEGGSLSPTMLDDEGPPPPPPPTGKFKVKTKIRTQSKELNQAKMSGSGIQTVSVDSTSKPTDVGHENYGFEDSDETEMKPIIFILNDPLDIQSAYKRLSTIFECEEDLDAILSSEMVEVQEETEQKEEEQAVRQICIAENDVTGNGQNSHSLQMQHSPNDPALDNQQQGKADSPRKEDTKKKFKFKFPKNKLARVSQMIRTGTNKTEKKSLKVVVYEEEVIASDSSPVRETKKQTKDSRRFEISSSKLDFGKGKVSDRDVKVSCSADNRDKSQTRVEELCKSTFDSIDSLEESIKQLEISVDSISVPYPTAASPSQSLNSHSDSSNRTLPGKNKQDRRRERSPSKRPATQILKGPNPPQSKRAKPQPPQESRQSTSKKQTSSSSSSSSAQRSNTKSCHSSSSSSPEKTAKRQPPANQKQPSQADSRSSRAAGDSSHCVVALRASKIPALCHSSGKHPSASLSAPHCSDTADSPQNLSSSSSSSASSPSASFFCGKHFLLSPPSNASKCPSRSSSPSSSPRTRLQGCSFSSLVKVSSSDSPPHSPSPPPPSHKSFIPSLNLSRLLPSSSHALSPSHAKVSSSKRQHHLVLTSSSTSTTSAQQSYYSSSSYSSSSPSSSPTSSSLSPTSSSSSPPSPSSSLLHAMVSHGAGSTRLSASNPGSPFRGRKHSRSQAVHTLRTTTATAASKDTS